MTGPVDEDAMVLPLGLGTPSSGPGLSADRVGSKARNLQRLAAIGLRVPPAFVLTTAACSAFQQADRRLPDSLREQIRSAVGLLEQDTGRRFGGRHPLLVSVRSSPPISMPGMLDTVLNVGLTEATVRGLIRARGNPWLAWDAYRRLAQAFAQTVRGCPPGPFDHLARTHVAAAGASSLPDLDPLALRDLARATAGLARALSGDGLPAEVDLQLDQAIEAIFRSWSSPRAREYRRLTGVPGDTGTAVIVQAMVFGNGGGTSGAGVGFTRDPSSGADDLYIDFLFNAQGEDVVSGRHAVAGMEGLGQVLPRVHQELRDAKHRLEVEFRDMQDFEFTVQDGTLYFLQTRSGKRTAWAALRIAVDLVAAGLASPQEGLAQLQPYDLDAIERRRLDAPDTVASLATAVAAGLGVASGAIVFDAERARARATQEPTILVRQDLATDDVAGIAAAAGVLTASGGRTSHAAVVARHLGKVCLVGCK
ncbi:MAG: PEP-utilizing enzyme, partial [Acidobacteriota bacterium]|nr:PEP-utilizing enzyme [Acidobacteriota bacterium]